MNKELKKLMKNFESDSTGRKRYNDFLLHCFMGKDEEAEFEAELDLNADINDDDDDLMLDEDSKDGGGLLQSTSKRVRMIFSVMASPNRIDILRILNSKGPLTYSELKSLAGFK